MKNAVGLSWNCCNTLRQRKGHGGTPKTRCTSEALQSDLMNLVLLKCPEFMPRRSAVMWFRRKPLIKKRSFLMEQLEERIVLDASVAVADAQPDQVDNVAVDSGPDAALGNAAIPGGAEGNGTAADSVLSDTPASSQPEQIITNTTLAGSVISDIGDNQTNRDGTRDSDVTAATVGQDQAAGTPEGDYAEASSVVAGNTDDFSQASSGTRILVVDSGLTNADDLIAVGQEGVTTILYDGTSETLQGLLSNIKEAVGSGSVESIAFASHNSGTGGFDLTGDYSVTSETLSSNSDLQAFWTEVGSVLAENGRIDLMACDVAATDAGDLLVSQLEALTGHDVAASDDDTGNPTSGGDWILETDNVNLIADYFDANLIEQFEGRLSTIDLTGKDGWMTLMTGTAFDPGRDQQAQKATTDLIGDATHGVLYGAYDDKGTTSDSDDEVGYRIRIGGPDSAGSFSSVILIGVDADLNGDIDLFITIEDEENGIKLWNPGSGANTSPNTTTTSYGGREFSLAGSYDFSLVAESNDPDWDTNTDLNSYNGPDYFVTFKIPFADIKAELAEDVTGNPGGIAITKDSPMQYVLGTSTQTNAFNSDIGGINGDINSSLTYEELGAFSPIVSFSNMFPVITSDGGGDTAAITLQTGTASVTTVTADDLNGDQLTYSITGGVDGSLFTINSVTGALSFIDAPNYYLPADSDGNNSYVVQVEVDDGKGGSDTQEITVNVTRTGDPDHPILEAVSGPDGATLDKQNTVVKYVFDEPIQSGSGNINVVSTKGDNWNIPIGGPTSLGGGLTVTTSISGNTLIMAFAGQLSNNATYSVSIPNGFITDLDGNSFPGFTSAGDPDDLTGTNDKHDFVTDTSQDSVAPSLVSLTPPDDDTTPNYDINVDADLALEFNEAVIGGSGFFYIYESGGTLVAKISATDANQVTYDTTAKTVILDPFDDLTKGTEYYVHVDSGAVTDLFGNAWGGIADSTSWNFSTVKDTTAPGVISVTSLNADGTWIEGDKIYVVVNFSEVVEVTGSPTLTLETGTTDETAVYLSGSGTSSLTFLYAVQSGNTSADLEYTSSSSLALNGGTIDDASGNDAVLTLPDTGSGNSLSDNKGLVIDVKPINTLSSTSTGVTEGSSKSFNVNPTISAGDADLGTDNLTTTLTVVNGTLTASASGSANVSGSGTGTVTVVGSITDVNAVLQGLTYTPNTGFNGTDSLQIVSWDGQTTAYGLKVQDTDTITIAVTAFDNDDPLAQDDNITVYKDKPYSGDVSTNDVIGLDGGTFKVTTGPTKGTVQMSSTSGVFFYTPNTGATGSDSFQYTITDSDNETSTATVSITIVDGSPEVTVTASDDAASEQGSDGGQFTVDLGEINSTGDKVTVTYSVSGSATGDSDYTGLTGSVDIWPGNQTATIDVSGIVDDSTPEGNETVIVILTGTSPGGFTINTSPATVTIADNDSTGPSTTPTITSVTDDVGLQQGTVADGGTTDDTGPALPGTISAALGAGETVRIYDGSTYLGTATVSGTDWTYQDTRTLSDGDTPSYTAKVADAEMNEGTASNAYSVTVDLTGPGTTPTITSVTDDVGLQQGTVANGGTTDDTGPALTGTISAALGAGETVRIYDGSTYLGTATVSGTDWTYQDTRTLSDGDTPSYTAKVADAALNEGTSSNAYSVTVDLTGPSTTPTITSVTDDVGLRQGTVANGGTTDDTGPALTGTISAALGAEETVRIYDGTTYLGTATVSGTDWTYQDTRTLSDGDTPSYTAKVADAALNEGTASSAYSVTVDLTGPGTTPTITSVTDDVGLQQGTVANGGTTDDTGPALTGTISATLTAGETVRIYDGTTYLGTATVSGTDWTYQDTRTLSDGDTPSYTAKVADAALNEGTASNAYSVTVDLTGPGTTPTITSVTDDVGLQQGTVADGGTTDDTGPALTGTISAALGAGETVRIYDGTTYLGTATVSGTDWTYQDTRTLSDGDTPSYTAKVADAALNEGTSSNAYSVTVDLTGPGTTPTITSVTDDVGLQQGTVANGGTTDDTGPALTGTISAALGAGETVRIYDGTTYLGTATVSGTDWTYQDTRTLSDGDTPSYTAKVADAALNEGTASSAYSVTVDLTGPGTTPTITSVTDDVGLQQGTVADGGTTDDTGPALTGTISATLASGETVRIYDGTTYLGTATVSGTDWTYQDTRTLSDGDTPSYTAKVADAALNEGTSSNAYSVTVDLTGPSTTPTITSVTDDVGLQQGTVADGGTTDDTGPALTGTISATLTAGETVRIYDGTTYLGTATVSGTDWTYQDTRTLSDGDTPSYTAKVADAALNEGTSSNAYSVTVDTTPPPVASDDNRSITEPTTAYTTAVLITDADTDFVDLCVTITGTPSATGTLTYNGDGTFTYDYTGGELSGTDVLSENFTYKVEDPDGGTDTGTITVTVKGDNDDPVASNGTGTIVGPTTSYTTGVLISDADTAIGDLKVDVVGNPSGTGTLRYNGDGTFTYSYNGGALAAGEEITEMFTYTVRDTDGFSVTRTITLTVKRSLDPTPGQDDAEPTGIASDWSARTESLSDLQFSETVVGPLTTVEQTGLGSAGTGIGIRGPEFVPESYEPNFMVHESDVPEFQILRTTPEESAQFGVGASDQELGGGGETPSGQGSPSEENTGLYGYVEEVGRGKVLVFNMEEIHFSDMLTSLPPKSSKPDYVTGLPGYVEGVEAGKNLVFNLDDISCLDLCVN